MGQARASGSDFVGAAGRFVPVGWYDRIVALGMREGAWRPLVAAEVWKAARAGGSVVEIGAGTGTLTQLLRAELDPSVELHAVEPDVRAGAIARSQGRAADVDWVEGLATDLPFDSGSQDAVVATLVLHHLEPEQKVGALEEAHRVLRPGGALIVADFGPPHDALMKLAFQVIRLADGRASTAGHADGVVAETAERVGFQPVEVLRRVRTGGGSLEVLSATRA